MKRLVDYNLTDDEIREIFGTAEKYKEDLEWYGENPDQDTENYFIAHLLFIRGNEAESLSLIKSIKDEEYRQNCLDEYASWHSTEDELVN